LIDGGWDNARMRKRPDFKRPLARTIRLKGDHGALLETLEDVVKFIGAMKPSQQTRPYWDRCAREILKAASSGKRFDVMEATRRFEIALRRDNLL
jgi:hypothetical protein